MIETIFFLLNKDFILYEQMKKTRKIKLIVTFKYP